MQKKKKSSTFRVPSRIWDKGNYIWTSRFVFPLLWWHFRADVLPGEVFVFLTQSAAVMPGYKRVWFRTRQSYTPQYTIGSSGAPTKPDPIPRIYRPLYTGAPYWSQFALLPQKQLFLKVFRSLATKLCCSYYSPRISLMRTYELQLWSKYCTMVQNNCESFTQLGFFKIENKEYLLNRKKALEILRQYTTYHFKGYGGLQVEFSVFTSDLYA